LYHPTRNNYPAQFHRCNIDTNYCVGAFVSFRQLLSAAGAVADFPALHQHAQNTFYFTSFGDMTL
jgi:hypothetical protein